MNLLLNFSNLLKMRTDFILYICAGVCFAGFLVVLLWYFLFTKRAENNKPTKSWTIESAKKYLESQNIEIKESSDESANQNIVKKVENKSTTAKAENSKVPVKPNIPSPVKPKVTPNKQNKK